MEREACVCDHGYERSDLCAEIIIIITAAKKKHKQAVSSESTARITALRFTAVCTHVL